MRVFLMFRSTMHAYPALPHSSGYRFDWMPDAGEYALDYSSHDEIN